jgi:hypothetical protein
LLVQSIGDLRMGLRERPVILLQLREQPHVLDGNDGLVGEGLEQCDLAFGKRLHFGAAETDGPERHPVAHQRNIQYCSVAPTPCQCAALRKLGFLDLQVRDVHGPALEHAATVQSFADEGHRILAHATEGNRTMMRRKK